MLKTPSKTLLRHFFSKMLPCKGLEGIKIHHAQNLLNKWYEKNCGIRYIMVTYFHVNSKTEIIS